jgi:hypothetical protein
MENAVTPFLFSREKGIRGEGVEEGNPSMIAAGIGTILN